jgi:Tfp pilus assembly protein PilO
MKGIDFKKIDWKKIVQNKNFSVLIIAVLSVLFLLDIFFVLMPEIRAIGSLDEEASLFIKKLSFGKIALAEVNKLKSEADSKMKKINQIEGRFAAEEDFELLIEEISKIASETNFKIIQIKPTRENVALNTVVKGDETYIRMPILIDGVSDYHSLGRFINGLESSNNLFIVDEMEIVSNLSDYKKSNMALRVRAILKAGQQ